MSKACLIITAVMIEGRIQAAVARTYGISQAWVFRLIAHYRLEGEAAFEPKSRRPKTSPNSVPTESVELIIRLRQDTPPQAWTPAPTPSGGTWPSTTTSPSPQPRSAVTWPKPDSSLRSQRSDPSPPTSASKPPPAQPATIEQLQTLLDVFVDEHNHRRPHRSLPQRATPAALFDTMPKALPGNSQDADTHDRIRHDRIDNTGAVTLRVNGQMHHIGIGRTHIVLLIQDLHVRIVNAITGELLRELTIDPSRDYQPRPRPQK